MTVTQVEILQEKEAVAQQIAFYKEHRRLFQFGSFYRVRETENDLFWMVVSDDRTEAVGIHYVRQNMPNQGQYPLRAAGLDRNMTYTLRSFPQDVHLADFGSLVNMISPVRLALMFRCAAEHIRMPPCLTYSVRRA